jgi:hypothetical protein
MLGAILQKLVECPDINSPPLKDVRIWAHVATMLNIGRNPIFIGNGNVNSCDTGSKPNYVDSSKCKVTNYEVC